MTTSELNKERLQTIASWRAKYSAGHNVVLPAEEAEMMARMLIAGMYQEPVAWIIHALGGDQLTQDGDYVANAEGISGIASTPLYTAPQPLNDAERTELQQYRKAATPELKPANLINKFYERYPLSEFKNDGERAGALGYFMAGAELQCFGEFVKYEDLCSDE